MRADLPLSTSAANASASGEPMNTTTDTDEARRIGLRVVSVPLEIAPNTNIDENSFLHPLADQVRKKLGSARIWHVNSTATGGGVVELLRSSMARHELLGLPAAWLVSEAEPEFFALTKRIHHGLHGRLTNGPFNEDDALLYRGATHRQAARLADFVQPGDLVVLHDPQTLGAAPHLIAAGARLAWRSHIGTLDPNPAVLHTWELLSLYAAQVPACVFTMADYAPQILTPDQIHVIRPSIDPFAAKNHPIGVDHAQQLLVRAGLAKAASDKADHGTARPIGRTIQDSYLPATAPVVLQISRWDPLKDMAGVLSAFTDRMAGSTDAHLVLAGPDPADIPDDPEGAETFAEVLRVYSKIDAKHRARVHLTTLNLTDVETNALAVNALQRRATVITQKSFEEGFGLTVTEAMWKGKPVVAASVGGIRVQIKDRENGRLIDSPGGLASFGDVVAELLRNPASAEELGRQAHLSCAKFFHADREMGDLLRLYQLLLSA